jgi:hypothetical protein
MHICFFKIYPVCFVCLKVINVGLGYMLGNLLSCFIAFSNFCFIRIFMLLPLSLSSKAKIYEALTVGLGWAIAVHNST